MKIEFPGSAAKIENIPIGGFFIFGRQEKQFGLSVSDEENKAAIVFDAKGKTSLARGGLFNETLVYFPHAVLRPDLSSIVIGGETGSPCGSLISSGVHYYITAQGESGYYTFNAESGAMEELPEDVNMFYFSGWNVGVMKDQKFESIFSFAAEA